MLLAPDRKRFPDSPFDVPRVVPPHHSRLARWRSGRRPSRARFGALLLRTGGWTWHPPETQGRAVSAKATSSSAQHPDLPRWSRARGRWKRSRLITGAARREGNRPCGSLHLLPDVPEDTPSPCELDVLHGHHLTVRLRKLELGELVASAAAFRRRDVRMRGFSFVSRVVLKSSEPSPVSVFCP